MQKFSVVAIAMYLATSTMEMLNFLTKSHLIFSLNFSQFLFFHAQEHIMCLAHIPDISEISNSKSTIKSIARYA